MVRLYAVLSLAGILMVLEVALGRERAWPLAAGEALLAATALLLLAIALLSRPSATLLPPEHRR